MKKSFLKMAMAVSICGAAAANTAWAQGTEGSCVVAGSPNAPITIEEFADFECGFCQTASNTVKEVLKNYPGKVKLIFRNMPLEFHPAAMVAAKAMSAVCLQSPSLAYEFESKIFDNQAKLVQEGEPFLYSTADSLGVDISQMKADMDSQKVAKIIADDQAAALAHKFQGTPSFMIGSEAVQGSIPYSEFKKIIDKQLAGH